jgi:hypothetical protein
VNVGGEVFLSPVGTQSRQAVENESPVCPVLFKAAVAASFFFFRKVLHRGSM